MTHIDNSDSHNTGMELPNGVTGLLLRPPLLRLQRRSWNGITVEEYSTPGGEGTYRLDCHRILLGLTDQDRSVFDVDGKRLWEAPLRRHLLTFTPAGRKVWAFGPEA